MIGQGGGHKPPLYIRSQGHNVNKEIPIIRYPWFRANNTLALKKSEEGDYENNILLKPEICSYLYMEPAKITAYVYIKYKVQKEAEGSVRSAERRRSFHIRPIDVSSWPRRPTHHWLPWQYRYLGGRRMYGFCQTRNHLHKWCCRAPGTHLLHVTERIKQLHRHRISAQSKRIHNYHTVRYISSVLTYKSTCANTFENLKIIRKQSSRII